jgi:hypothetical protein
MKTDFADDITIVADSKINSVESTSCVTNNRGITINNWLVVFANNLTSLKDDNLLKLPVIEY